MARAYGNQIVNIYQLIQSGSWVLCIDLEDLNGNTVLPRMIHSANCKMKMETLSRDDKSQQNHPTPCTGLRQSTSPTLPLLSNALEYLHPPRMSMRTLEIVTILFTIVSIIFILRPSKLDRHTVPDLICSRLPRPGFRAAHVRTKHGIIVQK